MTDYNVGLNLREQFDSPPTIQGVPVTIGGMVGRTRKGKMNKAVFVTSWEEFKRKMGSFYGGFDLPKHTRGFFVNRGRALWISRVLSAEVFASLVTGAADASLLWTARHPGVQGNNINIILTDPGSGPLPLSVTVTQIVGGWNIDVSLETDAVPAIISTANEVLAAVNAALDALQLVVVSLPAGTDGTGTMVAAVTAPLASGLGPSTADDWFYDSDLGDHALKISADNPGAWGNAVKITTQKVATYLMANVVGGANTEVEVNSIRDWKVGDLGVIDDGTNQDYFIVATVDTVNNKLTFVSKVLNAYTASASAIVKTASRHAVVTTITAALDNGATQINLNNAIGARVGSLIHVNDGTTETDLLVTGVSGNTIFFAVVTGLGAPIAANSPATSFEFQIDVEDDEGETESHALLSMEATNALNFVNIRLSGDQKESVLIEVEDQDPSNTPAYLDTPWPVNLQALIMGLDGETPSDARYIGVATPGAETGIYKFKGLKEVSMIATPGVTSLLVSQNGLNFCDTYLHAMYIASVPQSVDTVEEAIEYRDYTLVDSSMRGTLYFPWGVIYDPESDFTQLVQTSLEGWIMGVWANVRTNRGFEKAPANERILGIQGLATDGLTTDWDDASLLLNPRGVNIIREFTGKGIRIFGARTLLSESRPQQFIHVVATTIFIEQSVISDSLWSAFEPNNDDLTEDVEDQIGEFMYDLWKDEVFVPQSNSEEAYYVYAGDGLNPQAQRQAGLFKVKFGFQVVGTAEKVVFIVTNLKGQNSIEEQ